LLQRATDLFPVWAILFSAAAWLWPEFFAPARPAIVPLLGVIMFGMGITLAPADFAAVSRRPAVLGLGAALQFGVMPLAALVVARGVGLDPQLTAGLVLVGSCPGGTASNVICYLARADVALSITLTAVSTLAAVIATPLLTELYVGRAVEVDVGAMTLSIFRIVLIPVGLGVAANAWLGERLGAAKRVFPLVSVAAICTIIAIVLALSHERLGALSAAVVLAVILHNLIGMLVGYAVPRLLRLPEAVCRTLAIEVGMQNSGLGVALAIQYFSALAALPGALFSIWHNLSGSLLASLWSRRDRVAY
jgi:BASS family bile acid:Na+ symporter